MPSLQAGAPRAATHRAERPSRLAGPGEGLLRCSPRGWAPAPRSCTLWALDGTLKLHKAWGAPRIPGTSNLPQPLLPEGLLARQEGGGELEASWTFPGAPGAVPLRLCCLLRRPGLPETHRTAAVKRRGCQSGPHCGFSGCFPSKGQKQSREPALTPKHPQGLRAVSCDSMGGSWFAPY